MSSSQEKKVAISLAIELYKSAKTKAAQEDMSIESWVISLIEAALAEEPNLRKCELDPLDWGRIDSRIDQRVALLEKQIDGLSAVLERVKSEKGLEMRCGI